VVLEADIWLSFPILQQDRVTKLKSCCHRFYLLEGIFAFINCTTNKTVRNKCPVKC
jgi:hypothetical protein